VGVVGNVQEQLFAGEAPPHVYVPFGQQYQAGMNIHLRLTATGPEAEAQLLTALRREIRNVDAGLPVLTMVTMRGHLESSFEWWLVGTGARMFLIFGGVALLLAVIGLYGVRSYTVALRTREIGIRMALGEAAHEVQRRVVVDALRVASIGIVAGVVLALLAGKWLTVFLVNVSPYDARLLGGAAVSLAVVVSAAAYGPARRAARVDPVTALRAD
jgi:putative ABC transport system permease protein